MTLSEVKFDKLNTVEILCSEFSKDGKSAVRRKRDLYPMEVITGDDTLKGFYIEIANFSYFTDYVAWNDCGGVIAVKYLSFREEQEISDVTKVMHQNMEFKGTEGYKRRLSHMETAGEYINLTEIYALKLLNESELVDYYSKYRENYLTIKEREEREQEKQRQLEQQKTEDERQKLFNARILEAEDCIRRNKLLKNDSLDDGKHLILYLMKKHNINVPLKTQGWINNKLTSVLFAQDGVIHIQFYRGKGCKCSESVYKYLNLLKTAVDGTAD
ncbi:MAG: hypothetical protein J1E98_00440 [Lachnospiraceae bacterium]|nr:hypothetical protein [Lachnospiraceae bacterium]